MAQALREGRPVVALESTLIAHGLPRPSNVRVAREVEAIVRKTGAVPATIAVIAGTPVVGLDEAQLERLATATDVPKLSVRDLAVAVAQGRDGATTVASTAFLAARAGIRVFATGGLGGVHRDARETWDESADLLALSQTPVAVVCAGVKSVLDIGATLERLETLGVPVVGYRTDEFPRFYLRASGYRLDWRVETPEAVARILHAQAALGSRAGLVVANPIAADQQLDADLHDRVLRDGLAALKQQGITGKAVTPFLLAHFHGSTEGESLRVNTHIIRDNARLAGQVAAALADLERADGRGGQGGADHAQHAG